jgi:hypothetical protein
MCCCRPAGAQGFGAGFSTQHSTILQYPAAVQHQEWLPKAPAKVCGEQLILATGGIADKTA